MKKIFFIIALFALSSNYASAQLSLKEAVRLAKSNNKGIKSANLKDEAKRKSISTAWDRMMPSISIDFAYTHLNEDLVLDLDGIRDVMIGIQSKNQVGFSNLESLLKSGKALSDQEKAAIEAGTAQKLNASIPHFKETVKEQTSPQAKLTVSQPIFTGGRILSGIDAAEAQLEVQQAKSNIEKDDIIYSVINSYLNLLLAKENLKVRQEALETVKKHAEKALKLEAQGLIAKHDKLRADVALSEAKRNLFEAEEKLKMAKIALASVMESSDNFELADSLYYKAYSIDYNYLLSNAKNYNNSLKMIQSGSKVYEAKANADMGELLPTVFGFGFYNFFENYLSAIEPTWGFGLGARWQIDGLKSLHNYQESKIEKDAMELMAMEVERKIDLAIRNTSLEIRLAEEQFNQLNTSLDQARENLRLNEKRYETGLGTSLETLDAQLLYESIALKRLAALKDYYSGIASLNKFCNTPDEFISYWSNN